MSDDLSYAGLTRMMNSIPRAPPPMRLVVVPTWVHKKTWVFVPPRKVPPREIRWGTRKMWKRRFNKRTGWQLRTVPVEPDHVMRAPEGVTFCTAAQYAAIRKATK